MRPSQKTPAQKKGAVAQGVGLEFKPQCCKKKKKKKSCGAAGISLKPPGI
jgi:hypothetical protein